MSKHQVLIILGVWVMILPFLGFPHAFDTVLLILSGLVIIGISYSIRSKMKSQTGSKFSSGIPFVEHRTKQEQPASINSQSSSEQNESAVVG